MKTSKLALGLVVFQFPMVTHACTTIDNFSNPDLVRSSSAIVIARAEGYVQDAHGAARQWRIHDDPSDDWVDSYDVIEFRVIKVLKGHLSGDRVFAPGMLENYKGGNPNDPPYEMVRTGGQYGACFALDYEVGRQFLFMFRKGWPYWAALAPTHEEVSGEGDPWVWYVRGIIAAQADEQSDLDPVRQGD